MAHLLCLGLPHDQRKQAVEHILQALAVRLAERELIELHGALLAAGACHAEDAQVLPQLLLLLARLQDPGRARHLGAGKGCLSKSLEVGQCPNSTVLNWISATPGPAGSAEARDCDSSLTLLGNPQMRVRV